MKVARYPRVRKLSFHWPPLSIIMISWLWATLCCCVPPELPRPALEANYGGRSSSPAPDTFLQDTRGSLHTLSEYRGKAVLLVFWASWCPSCTYELPELEELQESFQDQPFQIVAVSIDSSMYDLRMFLGRTTYSFPILLDRNERLMELYRVSAIPSAFLIDPDGYLVYLRQAGMESPGFRLGGGYDWSSEKSMETISQLIVASRRK